MDFKSLTDPVILVSNAKSSGFFNKKQILAGLITVFLLFAVGLGVYISQKPTQFFPQAKNLQISLFVQPETKTATSNQEIVSDLFINSTGKIISKIKLVINFDPTKLQFEEVLNGGLFEEITLEPVTGNMVTINLRDKVSSATKSGTMASLKFKVIATSSAETIVKYNEADTKVTKSDNTNDGNILFRPQTITLNPTQASPSPSPSSSAGASPSPDASASASPAASASSAASPSPTASSSPIASPSPSGTGSQKGDGNNDGRIDLVDLSMLYSRWSPAIDITSGFNLDFNDDKRINSFDLAGMTTLLTRLGVI